MVQIKKYEQQVGVAAGGLGPRASGAFEAPGKALAGFGAKVDQVAFDFLERQKAAETKRVQDEEFTGFSEQADKFIRDDKSTDTEVFKANFQKEVVKKRRNAIDARTDLTQSQKDKIKQSLSSTALSFQFKGQNAAFGRGQAIRTDASRLKIQELVKQASLAPPGNPDRIRAEAGIYQELKDNVIDGIRTGYDSASIKTGLVAADLARSIDAAASIDELDQISTTIPGKGLPDGTSQKFKSRVRTRKREMRGLAYDQAVGDIDSLSVSAADKETFGEAIMSGTPISGVTDDGQKITIDTSQLLNGQRLNLKNAVLNPKFKDLVDLTNQNAVDELTTSEDALNAAMGLMTPESIDADGTTVADREDVIIEAAEQTAEETIRDIATGNFDPETAMDSLNTAKQLLESEISPNGSLSKMIGRKGDKASNILDKIANAEKAMNKANASNARMSALTEAGKTGDLQEAFRMMPDAKSGEFDQVIEDAMQRLDGDPQRQMDYLSRNGVINKGFQNKLKIGRSRLQVAGKTTLDDSDREAISIYRNLSLRQDLLTDHIKGEDLTWWRSFEVLSNTYGDEDALTLMQRQIPDADLNVSEKFLDEQIAVTDEEITEVDWWPFDKASPQNTGYMRGEIKKLAMEYVKYGVNQEQALKTAGEQFAASHMFIGNAITPIMPEFNKKTGVLKNIDKIASVVLDDFAKTNEQFLEDNDISVDDLSLLPFPGTADNFQIVIDGGRPIRGQDGQYVTLNQDELLAVDISEVRLQDVNKKIKSNVLDVEADKLISEDMDYQAQFGRKLM